MKALLVQANPTVGAIDGNLRAIRDGIARAQGSGVEVAVFPELAVTGYPPRDLVLKRGFVDDNLEAARAAAAATSGPITAIYGFVDRDPDGTLYNAAAIARDGAIQAVARKLLLPTYDVFDEDRYFRPGADPVLVPIGGRSCGVLICEDVWNDPDFWGHSSYPREPVGELAGRGMEALLVISASPFSTGRLALRRDMMRAFARRHRLPIAYLNQVGGNDSLVFDGSSFALDRAGRLIAQAGAFVAEDLSVDLDATGSPDPPDPGDAELAYRALAIGLADYVRKCGFSAVVLGLSGGIDSALTAAIAVEALGPDRVTAVMMPSRFTSADSLEDARATARGLGIRLLELGIDGIYSTFLDALAGPFAGTAFGTAEENIQARVRGNLLMALSNKFGWLVLSTGNKSELAVGYCTLYGDMSGGLAVISDLPKGMVYEVARVANRRCPAIPERVFTKAPTAELRPNQTDQDSLPPYPLLDAVLKAYVEDNLSVGEIVGRGFDEPLVRRVVAMVDRNEYKRSQAAPGLRVTSKAFGLGRRMPIAQAYTPPPGPGPTPATGGGR